MNVELFEGNPEALLVRLQALLAGPATTIDHVLESSSKAKYIITWS